MEVVSDFGDLAARYLECNSFGTSGVAACRTTPSCAKSDPCARPNLQVQGFVALCCTRDTVIASATAILLVFLLIYLARWGPSDRPGHPVVAH